MVYSSASAPMETLYNLAGSKRTARPGSRSANNCTERTGAERQKAEGLHPGLAVLSAEARPAARVRTPSYP